MLKKLIEQDNTQFIKEEQMNTLNINLIKKQMEDHQKNSFISRFPTYLNKKNEDDEDEDSNNNNFMGGNHYIC